MSPRQAGTRSRARSGAGTATEKETAPAVGAPFLLRAARRSRGRPELKRAAQNADAAAHRQRNRGNDRQREAAAAAFRITRVSQRIPDTRAEPYGADAAGPIRIQEERA